MRASLSWLAAAGALAWAGGAHAAPVDFQRDLQPILAAKCYSCHSAGRVKGGLQVDSLAAILGGGRSGKVVVPGQGTQSLLVKKADPDDPTPHKGVTLNAAQLALLKQWIDQGAGQTIVEVDLSKLSPELAKAIQEEMAKRKTPK